MKQVSLYSCEKEGKKKKKKTIEYNHLPDTQIPVTRVSFHKSPPEARNRLNCGLPSLKCVPGVSGLWREEAEGVGSG